MTVRWLAPLALAAAVGGSCNFAVKHPAITAGIVAGTVALGTCELASGDHAKCFATSGVVALGLAVIAGGALWLGSEDAPPPTDSKPPPPVDWSKVPDTTPAQPTQPPVPADAGAPVTPPPSPLPPPDAAPPTVDAAAP